MNSLFWMRIWGIGAITFLGSAGALAQSGGGGGGGTLPDYDFDWVTIGDANNAPYDGPDSSGDVTGRGSVGYEYRIGRLEVTTAQWMDFVSAFAGASGPRPGFAEYTPVFWGAIPDSTYQGPGERWKLNPNTNQAARLPVGGLSWRDAAMYCNWLHNGKGSDPMSLVSGAYDSTTWGTSPGGLFTDAPTHLPTARFWIPTLDEWIKAAHYDPARYGQDQGGWWRYMNRSDSPAIPGPPGVGTSSAGWDDPDVFNGQWQIPLGAYADSISPWGLLDTSGGAEEWTEFLFWPGNQCYRGLVGAPAGDPIFTIRDAIDSIDGMLPYSRSGDAGFRIASAIPSPACAVALAFGLGTQGLPRRRPLCHGN